MATDRSEADRCKVCHLPSIPGRISQECEACRGCYCTAHLYAHCCGSYRWITDEEYALLQAIIRAKDDDAPRLVYADWLSEHGEDDRATFICDAIREYRVSEAAFTPYTAPILCPTERGEPWVGLWYGKAAADIPTSNPVSHPYVRWTFSRGMISSVWCGLRDWEIHGPSLIQRQPIQSVLIVDKNPWGSANRSRAWFGSGMAGPACIPRAIYECLPSYQLWLNANNISYMNEARARIALGEACLKWARNETRRRAGWVEIAPGRWWKDATTLPNSGRSLRRRQRERGR